MLEDEHDECIECDRDVDHGYVVLGRGPFCSLTCAIVGTRDLITDEDREAAERLMERLGL